MIQLSKRLQAVAELAAGRVEHGGRSVADAPERTKTPQIKCVADEPERTKTQQIKCVADVGTDHGYLPIWLVEQGIADRAIAMDLRTGPLQRAQEHIREHQLGAYIETRLSDGLAALHRDEAQVIVIAGMGGATMSGILEAGQAVISPDTILVLQPQSELYEFRRYLVTHGFRLLSEDMVEEDGKYYPMMKVQKSCAVLDDMRREDSEEPDDVCGKDSEAPDDVRRERLDDVHGKGSADEETLSYTEEELRYGPLLLRERHPVLKEFLLWQLKQKERILEQIRSSGPEACGKAVSSDRAAREEKMPSEQVACVEEIPSDQATRREQRERELREEIAGMRKVLGRILKCGSQ